MPEQGLTVLARIMAKAGKEDEVFNELSALIAPTRQETGCMTYRLHRSSEITGLFLFYEKWRSRKDLDDHLAKPYLQALLGKADQLLAEPVGITFWVDIE